MHRLLFIFLLIFGKFIECISQPASISNCGLKLEKDVPDGLKLVWHDEFNEGRLDTNQWSTQYYSTWDFIDKTNYEAFKENNLPMPAMFFTDSTLVLYTNELSPEKAYWPSGRKISSIQTYDWNRDTCLSANFVGGYIEARIRRNASKDAKMVNGAFWLDSPGPDLKYFIEKGNRAFDVEGIRPSGQVFEIDLCEYLNTEIVLHGNVAADGTFKKNIGHHIVPGDFLNKWITHGMLWTPAGLKFYIDGKLVKEWWDPSDIKSPNHMMNLYLGIYAKGGKASMEVDYIRFYQWDLEKNNELPNGDFEYGNSLFPWEGSAGIEKEKVISGKQGVSIAPGDSIYQLVYLDHTQNYNVHFQACNTGNLKIRVENLKPVSSKVVGYFDAIYNIKPFFESFTLPFKTENDYKGHKTTVKVILINNSKQNIIVDQVMIKKRT